MIDTVVLIIYFSLIIGIGVYFSRGRKNSEDYFLAGKNVNWLVVAGSLLAIGISSEHLISLTAAGARRGLAIANFEWLAGLMVLILAWLFIPIYSRAQTYTVPEFLEQRYNRSIRFIISIFTILIYVCTRMTVILFAGGWLLNQVLGWDIMTTTVVIIVLTGVYTIAGGLKAVMYTDVAGAFILIIGAIVLMALGICETGGLSELKTQLTPEFFSVLKPLADPDFPWLGVLLGAPIIGIWYWCSDQMVVQRVLSAKNRDHANTGVLLAGFIKLLIILFLVVPGLIALVLFPEISADNALPAMMTSHLLPAGLKGIVIAMFLAAMMSSLAGVFNSTATLVTMDFYRIIKPGANQRKLVLVGRLTTAVLVILAILSVPLVRDLSLAFFKYLILIPFYLSPPIAVIFLFSLRKKAHVAAAMNTLVVGIIIGAARFLIEIFGVSVPNSYRWLLEMNLLYFTILLFVISMLIFVGTCLVSRQAVDQLLIEKMTYKSGQSSNRSLVFGSLAMILLVVIFISMFY